MEEVTFDGVPWSQLPASAAPVDPNSNLPGDREFIELLRERRFAEAKRRFPELYGNPHVAFLSQLTGQSAPADSEGHISPLSKEEFFAAIGYLEGPIRL